jgi:hypothetical protein
MPSDDASGRPIDGNETHVDFDKPAVLRKWPSLNNQRRTEGAGPYLLLEGTLDECIRKFMAEPAPMRHLYQIHTSPQPPLVGAVLSEEITVIGQHRADDCQVIWRGLTALVEHG